MLKVQNLSKRFGQTEVLKDISFNLDQGETLAIIGPSGSGKSTLLRCMIFLERLDAGEISVRGETIFSCYDQHTYDDRSIRQKRRHFGLVFQSFHLFPQYTTLENVILAPKLLAKNNTAFKTNKKDILEKIRLEGLNLLAQVGLSAKHDFYPHQLSGGQQQRVAIARALALGPDILCFDEPTSALDPELTGEVLKVIRGLADKHTTMIIVTHEMQFANEIADKVLFMDEGSMVEYGSPRDVFNNSSNERIKRFLERYSSN
ncbi:MAG: amino acid ABC transporter ATP-binding protein [Eubacterium sp.]|nr:amino acid ABC transporter ATP-binding protein [Eubacterium sp.]